MKLQDKIKRICDYLQESYYLIPSNIKIGGLETNDAIFMSIATSLVNGREIIFGNYGMGKTSMAEAVLSIIYSIPVEVYKVSKLRAHPEQTEEKMLGRPDLGSLNMGKENVIWSLFAQVPGKIIDEINRLPSGKQVELLDAVDRGVFTYLGKYLFEEDQPIFATQNYPDEASGELIPPLKDRFDVSVEARPSPFVNQIVKLDNEKNKKKISDKNLSKTIIELLSSKMDYEKKMEQLTKIREEFHSKREEFTLSPDELEKIKNEIKRNEMNKQAELFLIYLGLLRYDPYTGDKRSNESYEIENSHYSGYLSSMIENQISQRFFISLKKYSAFVSWFRKKRKISINDVLFVAPYSLAHRTEWKEEIKREFYSKRNRINNFDKSPINFYISKSVFKDIYEQFKEIEDNFKIGLISMKRNDREKLQSLVKEIDHPVFYAMLHYLEVENYDEKL